METYIIKVILASCVFIAFYFLLLEKEKSFKFNRFYLLSTLVFALVFPFLQYEVPAEPISTEIVPIFSEPASNLAVSQVEETGVNWTNILISVYAIVALFLFVKYVFNIVKLLNLKGKTIVYKNIKLKVLKQNLTPFSFLDTIFVGEKYFENNRIKDEIFQHEKTHIDSRHSYDLLFMELCMVFMWFNPAFYFYKKAFVSNHEFIADENVLRNFTDIRKYQHLILDEINQPKDRVSLTNHFYFNNTKQRIIMMTKSNKKTAKWKSFLSVPLIAGVAFFTVQKVYAKTEISNNAKAVVTNVYETTKLPEASSKIADEIKFEQIQKIDSSKNRKIKDSTKPTAPPIPPTPVAAPSDAPIPPTTEEIPAVVQQDEPAQFPGGLKRVRDLIMQYFDIAKIPSKKGEKSVERADVKILVNEDGKMSTLEVNSSNNEFAKEVKQTMLKIAAENTWIPGKKDGKPVKSYFKIPVTMAFE